MGDIHLNLNIADVVGPASGIILFSFAIGVFCSDEKLSKNDFKTFGQNRYN